MRYRFIVFFYLLSIIMLLYISFQNADNNSAKAQQLQQQPQQLTQQGAPIAIIPGIIGNVLL